ncbi:hypothetical protein GB931_15200 [Modestobacter sp. I12A-02628]|uniref:N-acetyltransferase domain-containing protein n=1 Tax=Goekera deserti TaxID=2497753 RepID=A0A7K3WA99_9ACTN|nr:GNAT family N-acetyltransferase [Goekera deserti]MPQ99239.1 hypothetical protein [Goekera deserti]NDI47574.1 hypothetical protein [Goekera deserti]NEL53385.1 hypothetical protein [Goekera deserti]
MTADLPRAERAVHARSLLALAAARAAGLPGVLDGGEVDGLRFTLCTSPGLAFLTGVTGVDADTVGALPGLLAALAGRGAEVVGVVGSPEVSPVLEELGLRRTAPRPIGVRAVGDADRAPRAGQSVTAPPVPGPPATALPVTRDDPAFLDVLVAGYGGDEAVRRFLAAEHADVRVRGFVARPDGVPVAAAALSLHGDVAVLGGSSTLPAHRGRGGQTALLHARLAAACGAGATLATATAAPGSPSARNLAQAGSTVHERPAWTAGRAGGPPS